MGVPRSIADELIDELRSSGLVGRLEESQAIVLVKSPELIGIQAVLDTLREKAPSGPPKMPNSGDAIDDVLRCRDDAAANALSGITLRVLAMKKPLSASPSVPSSQVAQALAREP